MFKVIYFLHSNVVNLASYNRWPKCLLGLCWVLTSLLAGTDVISLSLSSNDWAPLESHEPQALPVKAAASTWLVMRMEMLAL